MQYQIPHIRRQTDGPTIQATVPIFGVNQPDQARYAALQRARYIVSAPVHIHQGATNQSTAPIPGVSGPECRYYVPQIDKLLSGPFKQFSGPTVQQQYVFPPNQPEQVAYGQRANSWRYHAGPQRQIDQGGAQQTYIFPVSEPIRIATHQQPDLPRLTENTAPIQTFDFCLSQPEARKLNYTVALMPTTQALSWNTNDIVPIVFLHTLPIMGVGQ